MLCDVCACVCGNMHDILLSDMCARCASRSLVMNFSSKTIRKYSVFSTANAFTNGRSPIESRLLRIYMVYYSYAMREYVRVCAYELHTKNICAFFICFLRIQRTFDIVFFQLFQRVASVDTHTHTLEFSATAAPSSAIGVSRFLYAWKSYKCAAHMHQLRLFFNFFRTQCKQDRLTLDLNLCFFLAFDLFFFWLLLLFGVDWCWLVGAFGSRKH